MVGDCRVALWAPRNDWLLFNPWDFGTKTREDNPPAHSKLNIAAGIPIALDRKVVDLGTAEQMRFEVRFVRDQRPIILDRKHDRSLHAVAGDGLRPLGSGAFDDLAEPGFCLLNLPSRHRATGSAPTPS